MATQRRPLTPFSLRETANYRNPEFALSASPRVADASRRNVKVSDEAMSGREQWQQFLKSNCRNLVGAFGERSHAYISTGDA